MKMSFAQSPALGFVKADFVHAQEVKRSGKTLIDFDLSQSGTDKIKKWNTTEVNKKINLDISGKTFSFNLRQPITGDKVEVGPFDRNDANAILQEINAK